jgi:hypothetical protein
VSGVVWGPVKYPAILNSKIMGQTLIIPGGFISLVNVDFKCPSCQEAYTEDWYYKALYNSKHGVIYKTCRRCGERLGISSDIRGDTVVWLKTNEPNPKRPGRPKKKQP